MLIRFWIDIIVVCIVIESFFLNKILLVIFLKNMSLLLNAPKWKRPS